MKKIIFLLLTMAGFAGNNFGQSGFELEITEYPYYFVPVDVLEINGGEYIVVANKDSAFASVKHFPALYKISSTGDLLLSKQFYPDQGSTIHDLIATDAGNFIATGFLSSDTSIFFNLWIFKFDQDFNILWEKLYYLEYGYYYNLTCNSLIDYQGNIVTCGKSIQYFNGNETEAFILKMNQNGDTILTVIIDSTSEVTDIVQIQDSSGYIFTLDYNKLANANHSLYIDTVVTITPLLNSYFGRLNIEVINNNFIFTAVHLEGSDNGNLGICILDTDFTILDQNDFGKQDTTDYPAENKNIDFIDPNSIYFGGYSNIFYLDNPFLPVIKPPWYIINKVDSNLNLQWQKYYGGDAAYSLYNIAATNDGGVILLGKKFSYPEQYNTNTLHVLKLNSDGLIAGVQKPEIQVVDVLVYPNPGTEMIAVRNGTPGRILDMELYNNEGKIVLLHKNIGLYEEIIVPHIPAGVYHYQLRNKGDLIDSGSWIKQ